MPDLDILTVGRVNFDLYAQQLDVEFSDVAGWDAMVGGSPANVAIAAARLGLRSGLFSAVGNDLVGDWVVRALEREGVATEFVFRKRGPHTSLALRAQLAPDHPLAFYRHDPADIHLTREDADRLPLEHLRVFLMSADALARGSTAQACESILSHTRELHRTIYLDLDLRDVNWPDLDHYAASVEPAIEHADVVLGTAAEFAALLRLARDVDEEAVSLAVREALARENRVFVVKRGAQGATVLIGYDRVDVPARPITEASTVGAGDSFAAGLVFARLTGRDWLEAVDLGSACAAITVSRYGCSRGFPTLAELASFIDQPALAAATR